MPTEVTVHAWCDACYQDNAKVPGAAVRVALGGAKLREVLLCADHREALVVPLAALVQKAGVVVEEKAKGTPTAQKAPRPVAPAPPAGDVLDFPVVDDAGPVDVDALERAARTCPVCGMSSKSVAGLVQHAKNHHAQSVRELWGATCPICGVESGLLGGHAKNHDVVDVPTLFALAELRGDPAGIVAARRAQWEVAA